MSLYLKEKIREGGSHRSALYKLSDGRIVNNKDLEEIAGCVYETIILRIKLHGFSSVKVLEKTIKKGKQKPAALVSCINRGGVDWYICDKGLGYTANSLARVLKRDRKDISQLISQYGFQHPFVLKTKGIKAISTIEKRPFEGCKPPTWWERNLHKLPTCIDPRY